MLRQSARRILAALRPGDVLGRLGGDEFAVLLSRADHISTQSLVERLLGAFTAPFAFDGQEFGVSASVGYANWPGDGLTAKDLLASADQRMYQAKS